jgi:ribulose-5-phosphate 4-epimerase/fuculose-1-phosphate aldolase
MSNFDALIRDLVIANRILAREEVVDAYGHVSVRHPDNPNRFLIARSVAPELVGPEDIVELDLDAQPVHDEGRSDEVALGVWQAFDHAVEAQTGELIGHCTLPEGFGMAATEIGQMVTQLGSAKALWQ